MTKRDAAMTCVVTPLSKHDTTGGKCRLASQNQYRRELLCAFAALHTVTTRVVLFKAGDRAARGRAPRFHSVCTHPIGLPILSGRRDVLEGTTGLSQAVSHRVHRGK